MSRYLERIPARDAAMARVHGAASWASNHLPLLHDVVVGDDVEKIRWRATNTAAEQVHWYGVGGDSEVSKWRRPTWQNAMVLGVARDKLFEYADEIEGIHSALPYQKANTAPAAAYAVGNAVVAGRLPESKLEPPAPESEEAYTDFVEVAMRVGRDRLRAAVGVHVGLTNSFRDMKADIVEPRIPIEKLAEEYPNAIRL